MNMRHFLRGLGAVGIAAFLVACQSTNQKDGSAIDLGLGDDTKPEPETITDVELRAFCPRVILREGTAYFNTFTKGNENNPDELIYQANLGDVTRTCTFGGGIMNINVTAAGRIVSGPQGRSGSINMPIRVAVVDKSGVLFSELRKMNVAINSGVGAQQFLFQDSQISIPQPKDRGVQIFLGFDEGPYDTP